jgi:putative sugar O-methyltransferase
MVNFVGAEDNRSVSDDGAYVEFVESALRDYSVFARFKQSPVYQKILEHVSPELGMEYLRIVAQENPALVQEIHKFKINDLVGGAAPFDYPLVGLVSPSTLRYMKVASDLQLLFGDLKGARIAEIGVGYGGQLLVLDQVWRFHSYDLFDLPPVTELAARYLESHILNGAYRKCTLNQTAGDVEYDLVISNYAFSELPSHLQLKYVEKILAKSKRGYLTMNSGLPNSPIVGDYLSVEQMRGMLPPFEISPERPASAANNYILTWGATRPSPAG